MKNHAPPRLPPATVAGLMRPRVWTIPSHGSFAKVVAALLALPAGHDLYVLDRAGHYVGAVVLEALEPHLADAHHFDAAIASDLVDSWIEPVAPTLLLAQLAREFSRTRAERLPVVDSDRRLLGTVARIDLALRG